jgi:hypothetical protein
MSVLETAANVQDQILEALSAAEDAVLSAVKTVAERVEPVTSRIPEAPFSDQVAAPEQVIDQAFGFASKLLANQQHFALELSKALYPSKTTTASKARKSTTKATSKVA